MIFWISAIPLALAAVGFALAPFLWRGRNDDVAAGIRGRSDAAGHDGVPGVQEDAAGRGGDSGATGHPRERAGDRTDNNAAAADVDAGYRQSAHSTGGAEREQALRALYRQRLEEIEEEYAAGLLDASSRAEIERELARGLLDDFDLAQSASELPGRAAPVDAPGSGNTVEGRFRSDSGIGDDTGLENSAEGRGAANTVGELADHRGRPDTSIAPAGRGWAWVLVAVGIPLLALALYLRVGEPQAQVLRDAHRVVELDPQRDRAEIDRWRVLLANRLESRPDDAQSRYLLGQIHFGDGEYARAAEAFARAHASVGNDPTLDWAWLQALFLANGGWLDETGRVIAQRLLERQPNNAMVLEIVAIDAYRQGDYREAVGRFNQALGGALAPTQRAALQHFLVQARKMLGDLEPRIEVRLTASTPPPEPATLFVLARPLGGGMPYAVVRRAAAPLPDEVTLDDAVAMNPDLPLSAAANIEVVVRISQSGTAMRQPGDWEWVSDPLPIEDTPAISLAAELAPPVR